MITTAIWHVKELDLYKTVKPYRLDFDPEDDDFPRTNIERERVPDIPIRDIRDFQQTLKFDKCGFTILQVPQSVCSLDYDNKELVRKDYYPYIESEVQAFNEPLRPGARVLALDHKVRKRYQTFPVSSGQNYPDPQPVLVAHIDWTPESIASKLKNCVGEEIAREVTSSKYQFCHAWRPLFGPLKDYPLAVADYSTVDAETDFEECDDVTEKYGVDENYILYRRPGHHWYYLSDHEATEVLLFRQYDSTVGRKSGVPHCAVYTPESGNNAVPRQSIEVELVVYWK